MTLNANIRVFINFLAILGCETLFKGELRRNQLRFEIDMKKLRMKFSALNVDFEGPSLDFLGSRKPAHEGIKERYHRKSRYFTGVGQSFVKTVADGHEHAAYWSVYTIQETPSKLPAIVFKIHVLMLNVCRKFVAICYNEAGCLLEVC